MENGVKNVVSALRQKAEMLLNNRSQDSNSSSVETDILKLIHELEVYTIEFEVQHSELEFSKIVSRDVSERYNDLFNFSSTGYLILTNEGEIIDLNYTCALFLGKDRIELKNSRFSFLLNENDKQVFNSFTENIFASTSKKTCELSLLLDDSSIIFLSLSGVLSQNKKQCLVTVHDITDYKKSEMYKEMTREILQILNEPGSFNDAIHRTLFVLKTTMGIDAVGLRLQKGDDFPYLDQIGFSNDFLLAENTLVGIDKSGDKFKNLKKHVNLACSCGMVISGNVGKDKRFSTKGGSWWTNDSFPLCDIPAENDLRFHPRNNCIKLGYASIALVPIRNNSQIVGLIQFNDKRKKRFDRETIEVLEVIALHVGSAITRKHAEETIRKNEELLRSITENAPDTIMELDHEGTILYISRAFAGVGMEDILGTNLRKWISNDYQQEIANALSNVFTEGRPHTFESSAVDSNSETRWYRSGLSPVKTEGVIKFAVMIISDITDRLNSETIIKQNIARHRKIIETTQDGFWLVDMDGRLIEANEVYSNMSGYTVQELLTMRISDLEAIDTRVEIINRIQKIVVQGEDRFETQHRRKDGTIFDVELNIQYHPENGGQFVTFLHDITKRNRHLETIRQSEERHKLLAETMLQGVVYQNSEGSIIFMNPSAERILGKSQERFLGSSSVQEERDTIREDGSLFPGEEHPAMLALRTGKQYSGVVMGVFNPQLKEYRWISIDSIPLFRGEEKKPYEVYTIFEDITERKRVEDKLNYHAGLIENITDAIISTDENFRVKSWNKAAENIYGWSEEEVVGRPVSEILQTEYMEKSTREESIELLYKKNAWQDDVIQKRKDNTSVNILASVKVMRDKNGRITGLVSVNKDVTRIKKTEARLQQSNERYKSLFQGNHSVMLLLNPVTGEIVDANPAACNYYGWSKLEMCCKNIADINTLTKKEVTAEMQNARLEKRNHFYFKHRLANNEIRDVEVYSGPIRFGETIFLYSMVHDITESKKVSEELQKSKDSLRAILDATKESIIVFDRNVKVIEANETAATRLNVTLSDLVSKSLSEIIPPNVFATRSEFLKQVFSSGKQLKFEDQRLDYTFETNLFPIFENGKVTSVVSYSRDITQQKKAEEAIRVSEEKFRNLIYDMEVGVLLNGLQSEIKLVNPKAIELLGLTEEQLIGKTPFDPAWKAIHEDGSPFSGNEHPANHVIATGKPVRGMVMGVYQPMKAKYVWFLINSQPQLDDQDLVIQVVTTFIEITDLRETQTELREREQRLKFHFENSPLGVVEWDKNFVVTEWSKEAERIFGWEKEAAIGKPMEQLNLIYPEDTEIVNLSMERLYGGHENLIIHTNRNVKKTGEVLTCTWYNTVLFDKNGTMSSVMSLVQNITSQKEAEEKQRKSEEKFSLIYEKSSYIIALCRLEDGRIEDVNETFEKIFGFRKEEVIGKRTDELGMNLNFEFRENILNEIKSKGIVHDIESAFFTKSGEVRILHYNIDSVESENQKYLLITAEDITARKRMEEALRESEYFFRASQRAASLGSYKTNFETETWESSEVLDEIFGIGKDYARTVEGWLDITHPADREMMHRYLMDGVLAKGCSFDKEYRIVRKSDGETRWIHGLGKVDVGADNKVVSLVGTIQDITERKLKEETLRKLNQSLTALSKSTMAISESVDEDEYLNKICKIIIEDTDFAMVWIGYAENDKEKSIRNVASAGFMDHYLETIKLSWDDTEFGRGPTGVAIRTGEISICNNMFTDPDYEPWREQALKRGYSSSIVFPLKFGDKVFGAISIYSKEPDSFLADEIKLLSKLANDLAIGITTIRLRKAKQVAELALKKSNDELELQVKERTTELMKKNEAIKINEEKYRTVADFAANWEFWIDSDDVMLYCSPSCERITGHSSSEFIEKSSLIYDLIHPDDLHGFKEHKETESTAHVCDKEIQYRIIRKDGMIRWIGHYCKPIFDELGNFKGTRGSNKDITARKKMEALLTTSNQKYKLLSQNISDGIFICNYGKFEYVNQAVYNIFGYSGKELEGMHLTNLVSYDKSELLETFLYTKDVVNRSCSLEIECIRKDQMIVFVEVILNYVAEEQRVYGVVRDITERKFIQKKIVKAIIETEEKEKAYFSKELHDGLGPLLSTIRLYLQLTDRFATDELKEILNKSEEILDEAITTVREISNKLSPHLLTNYGLTSAIKNFVEKLNNSSKIKVLFESNYNKRMDADIEAALYRAVIECINNSLKHSNAQHVEILLQHSGDRVLLFYKDDGIGFDLKETVASHKGLGLFNLQNRIENIGGKLILESKPGFGVNYQFVINI